MKAIKKNKIIILGMGHLALRVTAKLQEIGYDVQHLSPESFKEISKNSVNVSKFEVAENLLEKIDFHSAKAVFIIDDKDSVNIELSLIFTKINQNNHVYVSLFNKALGDCLKKLHDKLYVFNPAAITAPFFADILDSQEENEDDDFDLKELFEPILQKSKFHFDKVLTSLIAIFISFFGMGVIFFKYVENLSWVDSFYFTAITVATVGYGDFSLRTSSNFSKIFDASFVLTSMVLVWILFSFFIDWLLRKRQEIQLGRRKYKLQNHIIICGLGRIGYQLAGEFIKRGLKVLAIESDDDCKFLEVAKEKGIKVFIGDATLSKNLIDAGVEKAAGVFVMVNDDLKNLEIGLTAVSLRKNKIPVVLRIFDEELALKIREQLKFRFAYSTTAFVAEYLIGTLDKH